MKSIHSILFILTALLTVGCNHQSESQQSDVLTTERAPATADLTTPDEEQISVVENDYTIPDSDGDGIEDADDPFPTDAPALISTPEVHFELHSTRTTSSTEVDLKNTVIAGKTVTLFVYAPDDGSRFWVQWRGEGKIWSEPVQPGQNLLDVPELQVHQVAIIRENEITAGQAVQWFGADDPIVFPMTESLYAGEEITLYGENLSAITSIKIGNTPVNIAPLGDYVAILSLPEFPESQVLNWEGTSGHTYRMYLDLYRHITLSADNQLTSSGWLTIFTDGVAHLEESPKLRVPAGQPLRVYFTHPDIPTSLSAQVWPDEDTIIVGPESTLETWLVQLLDSHGMSSTNWRKNRAYLPDLSGFNDLIAMIRDEQNGLVTPGASADSYASYLNAGITWTTPPGSISAQGIFAGTDPLFEQLVTVSNQRGIPGRKTFADISIARKGHVFCTQLPWEAEQVPANSWPSDLCVDNDTPVYTSVGAIDRNGKRLRTHQINEYFDKDMVGPKGFGMFGISSIVYLTTDSGAPLCRMQPCTVDIITGGFGLLSTDDLPPQFEDEYAYIASRTLIEKVIIEMIATATGTASDKSSPAFCMVKEMLEKPIGKATMMSTFLDTMQKMRGANTDKQKFDILSETVIKYALEYITAAAVAGAQGATECFTSTAAKQAAMNSARSAVSGTTKVVGKIALPLKIADAVTKAVDQWNIYTKPKYITFSIKPKAEVTAVRTPYVSVLSADDETGTLEIEGCHITNQKFDSSGNPDSDYEYFPEVVFTDSRGREATLQTNSTHRTELSDLCKSKLVIGVAELKTTLGSMKSGTVRTALNIKLPYDTDAFTGFPDSELPVPGKTFKWEGPVTLSGTKDNYLRPGLVNTLTGSNLKGLKNKTLLVYLQKGSDVTKISNVQYRDEEIDFFIPLTLSDGDYDLTLVTNSSTGEGVSLGYKLSVAPPSLSFITLTDRGVKHDDGFYVQLTDNVAHEIEVVETPVKLSLSENSTKRSNTGYFNGKGLTTKSGEAIALPLKMYLFCDKGGSDGYCTWGLNSKIVLPDSSEHIMKSSGKLKAGESTYVLAQ